MTTATKPPDEFDAIRLIYETLKPFPADDQQRLLRWVQEKLGLVASVPSGGTPQSQTGEHAHPVAVHQSHGGTNIKSFMEAKNPKSDNQFAAAVAYFYRFEASDAEKKDTITKDDLLTACRLVNRKRPERPAQVLVNAHHQGLLDKGGEPGQYRINSVGENLVAMVLPSQNGGGPKRPAKKNAKTKAAKKA